MEEFWRLKREAHGRLLDLLLVASSSRNKD